MKPFKEMLKLWNMHLFRGEIKVLYHQIGYIMTMGRLTLLD
jgi:hypothetical protein